MPCVDSIDVRIIVDGSPLTEYPDPESGVGESCSTTCYIEAKTDQSFGVKLRLLPGFDFRSAEFLCVQYQFDADVGWCGRIPVHGTSHRNGVLYAEETHLQRKVAFQDEATGDWKDHDLVFGVLEINESAPPVSLAPMRLEKVGSVRVTLYRSKRTTRIIPLVHKGLRPEVLDEVSEKSLKGKALNNNVKFRADGTPAKPLGPSRYKYEPVQGGAGKSYEFKFLYRSRRILQSIGCIPLTPSPPPDTNLMLERTEDMLRQEKLETSRLRALLAQATSRSPSSSHVDRGPPTPRVHGSSRRTRAKSQESGIKRESDVQFVDMTKKSVEPEPELPSTQLDNAEFKRQDSILSDATVRVKRVCFESPLSDDPKQPSKRAREDGEEVQSSGGTAKNVKAEVDNGERDPILIPSDEPLTTSAGTSLDEVKGPAKSESTDDKGQEFVTISPRAKRLKTFEVIDLTDD